MTALTAGIGFFGGFTMLLKQSRYLACLASIQFLSAPVPNQSFAQGSENSCAEIARLPVSAQQVYSDILDPQHRSYFLAQSGAQLLVYRVEKVQGAYNIIQLPSIPVSADGITSTAFVNDGVMLSRSIAQQTSSGGFHSPTALTEIPAFSLDDGSQNQISSFSDPSQSNMSPLNYSPFWSKNAPYLSWESRACPNYTEGQLGRLITSISGGNVVVANNFEFSEKYFDIPYSCGQQVYERNADGSTKMRVSRNYSDPAQPFFCDVVHPRPDVLGCTKIGTYESPGCLEITPTPTPIPTATPGAALDIVATPIPTPPAACAVRMEPDPIENVAGRAPEFCPSCPYYWWAMDPGFSIYSRTSTGAMVKSSSFRFPAVFGNQNIELPVSESEFALGKILQLRPNSATHGFAAAVELSAPQYPELNNSGGVYFFDSTGQFTGFTSAFFENGRTGRSLSALGQLEGRGVYASGSPENAIFHPGLSEFPSEWVHDFKPESGHVLFTQDDGELLSIQFGSTANDRFGSSLAGLGDVSGDGVPDALIGAAGGSYAVIASAGGETPGTILRFNGTSASGFGSTVGSVATGPSGKADVIIVGSETELILYDISTCLQSAISAEFYRLLILDEVAAALTALETVLVPAPATQAAGAFDALMNLNAHVRNLVVLLRTHPVVPNAVQNAAVVESASNALNGALRDHDTETVLIQSALDKKATLSSKLKRLQTKKKKAGGTLSKSEKKKMRKVKSELKLVTTEALAHSSAAEDAISTARASKQSLHDGLAGLVAQQLN